MVFGSGVLPGIKFLRVIHGVPCVGVSFLLIEQPGLFLIGVEGLHGACLCDVRRHRDCHTWVGAAPGIWWTKASDAAKHHTRVMTFPRTSAAQRLRIPGGLHEIPSYPQGTCLKPSVA